MVETFIRKKVESLTLGEKIKKLRGQYRMSLAEISKSTKIQVKYLEYLEAGAYDQLPADVYVRGFLKSIARHLGLDENALLKLHASERNIQANLGRELPTPSRPRLPLTSSFVLTPRAVVFSLAVLIIGGTFLYLFLGFRSFVVEPALMIVEPMDGATIDGGSVAVRGQTDRGARVFINGQEVFVDSEGAFGEQLALQPGLNQMTVSARNRFDKEKTENVAVEARLTIASPETIEEAKDKFVLKVVAPERAVMITLVVDGQTVYSGKLEQGLERTVTAEQAVVISTNNGQATWVGVRGDEPQPLSNLSRPLENVIFTNAGKQP